MFRPYTSNKAKKDSAFHAMFNHFKDEAEPAMTYTDLAKARYPDVPEPHFLTWDCSDQETRNSNDWQVELSKTKAVLLAAAEECDALAATQLTTPTSLTMTINRLKAALYKTEDTIAALRDMYPLPSVRTPAELAKQLDPAIPFPMLLCNNEDHILFWLPTLPNKSRSVNSHLYTDFQVLLRANHFAPYGSWHCDFVHVFSPSNQCAILGARDVDNYPYKPFIDALVLALRSSDAAFNFSYGAYNLLSDCVKSGCYISITKRAKKVGFFQEFEKQILALK